jgi:GNAT superfamily N-acetyltransferase
VHSEYQITNTLITDVDQIFHLFDQSIEYQQKHGYPAWWNYDKEAIIKDIERQNQYKIVIEQTIAIVFSVCYADKLIWRHFENGDSVYLHRIVVNPAFKGQQLFGKILEWSIGHCTEKGLRIVRMDTWAANPTIINYYKRFGFKTVENYTTPDSSELPVHNRNLELTLLEYNLIQHKEPIS